MLRDSDGRLIFAYYKEFGETNVRFTENLSLLHGFQLCQWELEGKLIVEVDSENLVRLIISRMVAKWPLCNTLRRIQALLDFFSALIAHIFREANSLVDMLANLFLPSRVFLHFI